jgi:hypothetical protein
MGKDITYYVWKCRPGEMVLEGIDITELRKRLNPEVTKVYTEYQYHLTGECLEIKITSFGYDSSSKEFKQIAPTQRMQISEKEAVKGLRKVLMGDLKVR